MVSSIGSFSSLGSTQGMDTHLNASSLTADQQSQIQEILSQYDASNVSEDDAKAIFEAFRKAGIRPAKGMKETIEAAGFDAEDLRTKGLGDPPARSGMVPPSKEDFNLDALQKMEEILSHYDMSSITEDQMTQLMKQLDKAGLLQTGSTLDIQA